MMGFTSFGFFGMILWWVVIIVLVAFLIRWLMQQTQCQGKSTSQQSGALEILKERYARGEINKKEFEEKKRDLMKC